MMMPSIAILAEKHLGIRWVKASAIPNMTYPTPSIASPLGICNAEIKCLASLSGKKVIYYFFLILFIVIYKNFPYIWRVYSHSMFVACTPNFGWQVQGTYLEKLNLKRFANKVIREGQKNARYLIK